MKFTCFQCGKLLSKEEIHFYRNVCRGFVCHNCWSKFKEYKINEFITLKSNKINGITIIYVNGEPFRQCKYLLLNIPLKDKDKNNQIDSIDNIGEILGWKYGGQEEVSYFQYNIDHKTEFWGHCSNLQAWYENDYDTQLLHRSIAFPLLKKLVEIGDPVAKRVFTEEIVKRYESGFSNIIEFIIEENLFQYLNNKERKRLIEKNFSVILENIDKYNHKFVIFSHLFDESKEIELHKKNFAVFLETINKFTGYLKYKTFSHLFSSIKNSELIIKYNSQIKNICQEILKNKLPAYHQWDTFSELLKITETMGWIEEYFPTFLELLEELPMYGISAFNNLIKLAKEKGFFEENFLSILESIDKFRGLDKNTAYYRLIASIKDTELMDKYYSQIEAKFLVFFKTIDKLYGYMKYQLFYELVNSIKDTRILSAHFTHIKKKFLMILKTLEDISNDDKDDGHGDVYEERYETFSSFLELAEETELIRELIPAFLKKLKILKGDDKYNALFNLIEITIEKGLMKDHIVVFLNFIETFSDYRKRRACLKLMNVIRGTDLENDNNIKNWKENNS